MSEWEDLVKKNLKQTRTAYLRGMRYEKPDDYSVIFVMEGKGESRLGLMLERGASDFDIKQGMERSSKRKNKAGGGWFIHIPFQLATSEALAESPVFAGRMPKPIEGLAKKLKSGQSLSQSSIPKPFDKSSRAAFTGTSGKYYPEYKHKSSIYAGLQHNTDKKYHGQYKNFRTISDTSDENAFIHPGFTARNFMEQALENIRIDQLYGHLKKTFLSSYL